MNFQKELRLLVNRALEAGAQPTAIIGMMEMAKTELATRVLAAHADQQARILTAKILPPQRQAMKCRTPSPATMSFILTNRRVVFIKSKRAGWVRFPVQAETLQALCITIVSMLGVAAFKGKFPKR